MTRSTLVVRPAGTHDLAAVTALDARAYGGAGYGPYVVRQLHDLAPEALLVAETDAGIAGYCAAAVGTDGRGWILSLAVDPDARGQGLGRALMVAALEALRGLGAHPIELTVAPTNTSACALYRSLGFVDERLEADYYGPGEDRLVLVLAAP